MGMLMIPSLEEKRFLKIENVSADEAFKLANWFEQQVISNRKIKNLEMTDTSMLFYHNHIDTDELDEWFEYTDLELMTAVFDHLLVSEVPQKRGARMVYCDVESNCVGVGTTVVYNQNWASTGFDDSNIYNVLTDADKLSEKFKFD